MNATAIHVSGVWAMQCLDLAQYILSKGNCNIDLSLGSHDRNLHEKIYESFHNCHQCASQQLQMMHCCDRINIYVVLKKSLSLSFVLKLLKAQEIINL